MVKCSFAELGDLRKSARPMATKILIPVLRENKMFSKPNKTVLLEVFKQSEEIDKFISLTFTALQKLILSFFNAENLSNPDE